MAAITLSGVGKAYPDGTVAVADLDLEIADGELMVLVGPSGSGKTTALRMIAGLEEITNGTIRIGDRVVNKVPPRDRDVAMVFQNYALYPHLSVRENIAFGLTLRRLPKAEIAKRVQEAAALLGLTPYLDRKPGALSGGQRQRVAMGRAIVRQPQAFLMDEPLSNLDAKLRVQMRAEVLRLQRDLGITTVYVTHDQVEAMTMGDRVAVLSDGRLQQVDTPRALYDRPVNAFVAGFIGSPPMNMLEARIDGQGEAPQLRIGTSSVPLPPAALTAHPSLRTHLGGTLIAGIRPEELVDARLEADPAATGRIQGEATLVESLGAEILVHLRLDGTGDDGPDVVARFGPRSTVDNGDRIELAFDPVRIHLFDPDTGAALDTEVAGSPVGSGTDERPGTGGHDHHHGGTGDTEHGDTEDTATAGGSR